jgi:hypothetical protein
MRLSLGAILIALFLVHCESVGTSGGDLANLHDDATVFGTPIADQNKMVTDDAGTHHALPNGAPFSAHYVVVTALDGVGDFYVQDPNQPPAGTPWSGMYIYRGTTSPPSLTLLPGDGVWVFGSYAPYIPASGGFATALPELSSAILSLEYEGNPPAPIDLDFAALDTADATIPMSYSGMLVRFHNVQVLAAFDSKYHQANIYVGTNQSFQLAAPLYAATSEMNVGATYATVTGILSYYVSFLLCPRSAADIGPIIAGPDAGPDAGAPDTNQSDSSADAGQ